jgi:opacity protein-like surface antigen
MKKIVAFIAFLSLAATTAQAQQLRGDVRFGFQMSPAFSWMATSTNKINTSGTNLGLKLGMVGEYYFQESYAISSGIGFFFNTGGTLLHERAGNFWVNSDLPEACRNLSRDAKLKYSLQYVEIPIGLKMRTREFGYVRYYIEPNLGLGFRTQAKGDITNRGGEECQDLSIRSDVALFNLFWGLGGGLEYSVSENTSLLAGLGMQFGFADVTKNQDTVILENGSLAAEKSKGVIRALVLRLGVMF